MSNPPCLWYKDRKKFQLGDICRYKVTFTNRDPERTEIYFRVKNLEKTGLRAIHLVNGPFIIYCHVIPAKYDPRAKFERASDKSNAEVCFRNEIKPGQTFNVNLSLNKNSEICANPDGSTTHAWTCDLMCQLVLNRHATVLYAVMVGDDLAAMRRISRLTLTSFTKGEFAVPFAEDSGHDGPWGEVTHDGLSIECMETGDIWNKQPRVPEKPIHLVIVTHGIFLNLTADMLYLRDMLMSVEADNYLVEGYRGNAGRTEKGIHRLGVGVSTYVTDLIKELQGKNRHVERISFVGHSLGGPVQLYALKHILMVNGEDYFEKQGIKLKHFVCLASPMLGILSEMSLWILWFLDLGTLGKTGRDLTLLKKLPNLKRHGEQKFGMVRPILETLPDEPVQSLLRQFELRVVYANAVNDGIVPLRTSALLYLDWEALGDVRELVNHLKSMDDEKNGNGALHAHGDTDMDNAQSSNSGGENVGQIPEESEINLKEKYTSFLTRIFNIDSDSPIVPKKPHRPKRIKRKIQKKYARISAKSSDKRNGEVTQTDTASEEASSLNIPPKASAVESAINSLICPIPSRGYIDDPESRTPVIFHDKYYHFSNIPDQEEKLEKKCQIFRYRDWRLEKQVKIARKYHASGVNWRKVLVYLPPDAHNNIIVRRRFANGYGWGVIEHLRQEIFGGERLAAKF